MEKKCQFCFKFLTFSSINYRFGVPLIDGGTVRLPAIVGLGRAMDLILTGRPIKGSEALDWGLANRLVACGTGKSLNVKLFP